MTLHETIFTRRSVRKYDMTPLGAEVLDDVKKYLSGIKQLNGQKTWFEIVPSDAASNNKAPHYIIAYCKPTAAEYINVGYTLQMADLYLQSKGFGSLWLGGASPKGDLKTNECCVMMAFGKTDVPKRKNATEFKRLPIDEISNQDNKVARAARVAPSSWNSQPWKLFFKDNSVTVEYFGRGMLKAFLKKKLNKIDIGIVTRYIELALQQEGKEITSISINADSKKPNVMIAYK